MKAPVHTYDLVVIGGGAAGRTAAVEAAHESCRVLLVEAKARTASRAPRRAVAASRVLRELALTRDPEAGPVDLASWSGAAVDDELSRLQHEMDRSGVAQWHGRARFASRHELEVEGVDGRLRRVYAPAFVVATGSIPRAPPDMTVDCERVFDCDSISSLAHLPSTVAVLGAGATGLEFATVLARLGTEVTLVDRQQRPATRLDEEIGARLVKELRRSGGRFVGGRSVVRVDADGLSQVVVALDSGETLFAEKALLAFGRVPNLRRLCSDRVCFETTIDGFLRVDRWQRTSLRHIYAAGAVTGPRGTGCSEAEQGRRAARHATGLDCTEEPTPVPVRFSTIPEVASVGLTEGAALRDHERVIVGRARFGEGLRSDGTDLRRDEEGGLLKMLSDRTGRVLLGVQAVGEGAYDLVRQAHSALKDRPDVDALAGATDEAARHEALKVAARDIRWQRPGPCRRSESAGTSGTRNVARPRESTL